MAGDNTTDLESLRQASLALITDVSTSNAMAIVLDLIDIFSGSVCLKIFYSSKTLTANVFILSCAVYCNDIAHMLYDVVFSSWHYSNHVRGINEVMPIKQCFYIICVQLFFYTTASALKMCVAMTRLVNVAFPTRNAGKNVFRVLVALCCLFGASCIGVAFLDVFGNVPVLYCSRRTGLGGVARYASWFLWLALDGSTMMLLLFGAVVSWIRVSFQVFKHLRWVISGSIAFRSK